jgi:nitrogen regulatory protein P-II 1
MIMEEAKLLVVIIKKRLSQKLFKAAQGMGLEIMITLSGKGTVQKELYESLLGLTYDPDKDVILTLVNQSELGEVRETIIEVGKIRSKNTGIMFTVDLSDYPELKTLIGVL